MTKFASTPRSKFKPANAFDELMKTASSQDEGVDFRKLRGIRDDLMEATKSAATDLSGAQMQEGIDFESLYKEASAAYRDGYSVREILHACVTGADLTDIPDYIATKVASHLAERLAVDVEKVTGLGLNKTASLGEVDPEHPLPARFQKAAQASTQRVHLEIALDDLRKDRDHFQRQIESLYV